MKTTFNDQVQISDFSMSFRPEEKSTSFKTCPRSEMLHQTSTTTNRFRVAAVTVQAAVKITRLERMKRRARWMTKKLIVFIVSHVGLTFLVALYAIAGGFIFQNLENSQSLQNNSNFVNNTETIRNYHVEYMWNLTIELNVLYPDLWKEMANEELNSFAKEIVAAEREKEKSAKDEITEWTYPKALLFAITIITTIGYGDTVPKTWQSKLVCIVYAMIGIPLTLICLTNIGSLMASVYRFTWKNVCHLWLVVTRAPERNEPQPETSAVHVPIVVSLATMAVYIVGGAAIFSKWEDWLFLDGCYFCFITLSTIGFGDFVPGQNKETFESKFKRVVCAMYLLFGLALLSMAFQLIQDSVLAVVSRYASLLGLSDSKIKKDIEECTRETNLENKEREQILNF